MTGWESDVIAEAGATDTDSSTTGGYVGGTRFVIAAAGYTGSGTPTGTPLAIGAGNIVTTQNGTEFFIDPTTNNTIRDENDGGGSLTLVSPSAYENLQFFVTGVGGAGTPFTATVNFSDASTVILTAGIADWQGSQTYDAFADKTSHVDTNSDTYFGTGLWTREISFDLSLADQEKTITSIDLTLASRIGVSGVSGTPIPEPSSLLLVGLACSGLLRRKR